MTLLTTPAPLSPTTEQPLGSLTTHELSSIVRQVASTPRGWRPRVRFTPQHLTTRLVAVRGADVWLVCWLPSQSSGPLLHAGIATSFAILDGVLAESRADDVLGSWTTTLHAPAVRLVEPGTRHALRNDLTRPAVTLHAFSQRMDQYGGGTCGDWPATG